MSAPKQDNSNPFPNEEQENTYSQWLDKLHCTCPAGAQIRPSSLPSATIDLGDVIADHTRIVSAFASAYSMITVILKMIACIIDVLCCLTNPWCTLYAIIRLFGSCLPDFILLFPQFAVPAIIICVIKIILAIIEYILTVLLPLIQEIIENIQDLVDAFADQNQDAISAVAFKLAALVKELYNVIGILAVLNAIWTMINALLSAGINIPCGGSGGSCSECGDDDEICPSTLQQTSFTGNDGSFFIIYGDDGFSYQILFYSSIRKSDFLQIRRFFPRGMNYTEIRDEDDVPYVLNVTLSDGSISRYIVTSVDSSGYSTLYQIPPDYLSDGYLSNTDQNGVPFVDPLYARFNTKTETFTFNIGSIDRYITMQDTRGAYQSSINGGSWKIESKYDGYNVLLKRDIDTWVYGAPTEHLRWKLEPSAPTLISNLKFELEINHEELIRHSLIGVGCHPSVRATREALTNRFPDAINLSLPTLPDFNKMMFNIESCVSNIAPIDVDSQYIIDNYQSISTQITGLNDCVSNELNGFKTEIEDYASQIYPVIFDPEVSADGYDGTVQADGTPADGYYFDVNPKIQIIGQYSNIQLIPFDRNGGKLGITVPQGIVEVEFETDLGILTNTTEELDGSDSTGKYTSTITSLTPGTSSIKAKVGERYVSYFNGSDLIPKEINVEFVSPEEARRRSTVVSGETSTEPLGKGKVE